MRRPWPAVPQRDREREKIRNDTSEPEVNINISANNGSEKF